MSRIGNQPVKIPEGVTVDCRPGFLLVKGPKGELKQKIRPEIEVAVETGEIKIRRKKDNKFSRSLHGLTRSLVANMIKGVTEEYRLVLKLVGTGYRASQTEGKLVLSLGFSHPVEIEPIEGIQFTVPDKETINIAGIDKQLVGQVAAMIRHKRPPEPYKGKGIRYEKETVRRKAGKAGKVGAAGFGAGE